MPWEILTTTDYPAVLAALDTKLTSGDIPDTMLDRTIYKAAAIQDVVGIYPTAASNAVAVEQVKITRAAIYFCAARLAPAAVRITSLNVSTRDMSYSRQTYDPAERAAELRALATAELADIVTPADETPNMPTMFALATGRRGK
jgi:hypothetical protein